MFARHGIPEVVTSDNGPQFRTEFTAFVKEWGFRHVTCSPKHVQANGFAEAMVKVAKQRLKKATDPYKALLAYRASPLSNGFSPAQLLFSRQLRTTVPVSPDLLEPCIPDRASLESAEERAKEQQEIYYNNRHGVHPLLPLKPNQCVWVADLRCKGIILNEADTPRSYWIRTHKGTIRRNRRFLVLDRGRAAEIHDVPSMHDLPPVRQAERPSTAEASSRSSSTGRMQGGHYVTRFGRMVRRPRCLS